VIAPRHPREHVGSARSPVETLVRVFKEHRPAWIEVDLARSVSTLPPSVPRRRGLLYRVASRPETRADLLATRRMRPFGARSGRGRRSPSAPSCRMAAIGGPSQIGEAASRLYLKRRDLQTSSVSAPSRFAHRERPDPVPHA
jgi:hypothetical protein